ncbi:MAG: efflux RND transporter periplasmic adaptor subunit [Clostridia bacterium]|nr:efflux RND transporter periplasmic adaptor subunit [Clostridia bacterium]
MKLKLIKNKWITWVGGAVVVGGVILGVYSFNGQQENTTEAAEIQEYTLTKQAISETLSTSGVVKAEDIEQLLGDVESEVTTINVEIGDHVTAGDVLAEMNPIDVESDILNQEVTIANLKQEIHALKADKGTTKRLAYENAKTALGNAKTTYEGNQILFENGALSQSDLDTSHESYNKAVSEYESAKVAYESYDYDTEYSILEKRLQVENTKLESLEQDKLDHKVVASIDGVVTQLNIEEGEIPKESDVMIEIQDLANLKIEASISEYEVNSIQEGQRVEITTLSDDDKVYDGVVERIYPSGEISGSEVFVTVLIDVLNEDTNLKPNFSANLEIMVAEKDDALLVPYDALIKTPNGYAVQVKTDDPENPQIIAVETGIESDLTVEVISDQLEEGMTILVESDVDLTTVTSNGGVMIPGMGGGMGGPPSDGGGGGRPGGA